MTQEPTEDVLAGPAVNHAPAHQPSVTTPAQRTAGGVGGRPLPPVPPTPPATAALSAAQVEAVSGAVRRTALGAGARPSDADDLVQETLARLLQAPGRPDGEALVRYAVRTARNLMADGARGDDVRRRHLPLLLDDRGGDDPQDVVIDLERDGAVREALSGLDAHDREVLLAHDLHGVELAALAREHGRSPGALAAQLARSRARSRVAYVLALRRVHLPSRTCRPVLVALSAGDRRRQRALSADRHLVSCATCARLAGPLLERHSRLAGLALPALGLGAWWRSQVRPRQLVAATVGATAVAAAATLTVPAGRNHPPAAVRSHLPSVASHPPAVASPPPAAGPPPATARHHPPVATAGPALVGGDGMTARSAGSLGAAGAVLPVDGLGAVLFPEAGDTLDADARTVVLRAAQRARVAHLRRLVVTGYTDTSGPAALNLALSQRRALAVAALLRAQLGPEVDVVARGRSENAPAANEQRPDRLEQAEARKVNRRVTVTPG